MSNGSVVKQSHPIINIPTFQHLPLRLRPSFPFVCLFQTLDRPIAPEGILRHHHIVAWLHPSRWLPHLTPFFWYLIKRWIFPMQIQMRDYVVVFHYKNTNAAMFMRRSHTSQNCRLLRQHTNAEPVFAEPSSFRQWLFVRSLTNVSEKLRFIYSWIYDYEFDTKRGTYVIRSGIQVCSYAEKIPYLWCPQASLPIIHSTRLIMHAIMIASQSKRDPHTAVRNELVSLSAMHAAIIVLFSLFKANVNTRTQRLT